MTTYGIGYKYNGRKDVSKDFLDNDIACMNHDPEKFPYFVGLFKEIKDKDIIVLKTSPMSERKLKIRAIGRVSKSKFERKGNLGLGMMIMESKKSIHIVMEDGIKDAWRFIKNIIQK